MDKIRTTLFLFVFLAQSVWATSPIPTYEINESYSGSWYNPGQSGHGLAVEVLDESTTVIYWYVYKPDGTPVFLITVGQNEGNATSGNTYIYSGMKFGEFNPTDLVEDTWGTVSLTFYGCDDAELSYSSNDPEYGSGSISMVRLVSIKNNQCTASPAQGNYKLVHRETNEDGDVVVTTGYALLYGNNDLVFMLGTVTPGFGTSADVVGIGSWFYDNSSETFSFETTHYDGSGNEEPAFVIRDAYLTRDGFTIFEFPEFMEATHLRSFQKGLTTLDFEGTHSIVDGDIGIGNVTITGDGKMTGGIGDCTLEGAVQVPDSRFNQAGFQFELKECDNPQTIYGAMFINEVIQMIATNSSNGFVWLLF